MRSYFNFVTVLFEQYISVNFNPKKTRFEPAFYYGPLK